MPGSTAVALERAIQIAAAAGNAVDVAQAMGRGPRWTGAGPDQAQAVLVGPIRSPQPL